MVAELAGAERDHLFHPVHRPGPAARRWLGGLLPLLIAGWRGMRPSPVAAALHLSVVVGGIVAAWHRATADSSSPPSSWSPAHWSGRRCRCGPSSRAASDPVLAPLALASAALFVPFVLSEAGLQNGMHDEHAEFSHNFDMVWIGVALVLAAVAAATVQAAQPAGALGDARDRRRRRDPVRLHAGGHVVAAGHRPRRPGCGGDRRAAHPNG